MQSYVTSLLLSWQCWKILQMAPGNGTSTCEPWGDHGYKHNHGRFTLHHHQMNSFPLWMMLVERHLEHSFRLPLQVQAAGLWMILPGLVCTHRETPHTCHAARRELMNSFTRQSCHIPQTHTHTPHTKFYSLNAILMLKGSKSQLSFMIGSWLTKVTTLAEKK